MVALVALLVGAVKGIAVVAAAVDRMHVVAQVLPAEGLVETDAVADRGQIEAVGVAALAPEDAARSRPSVPGRSAVGAWTGEEQAVLVVVVELAIGERGRGQRGCVVIPNHGQPGEVEPACG